MLTHMMRRAYALFGEQPEGDRIANAVSMFILGLIFVNVVVSVVETEPAIYEASPAFFFWFEAFSVAIFTIEYVGRLWGCVTDPKFRGSVRGRIKAATRPMAIIDFLAIMPFYLGLIGFTAIDLRFLRTLRLLRLFRLFKYGPFARAVRLLSSVLRARSADFAVSGVLVLMMITMSASVMWILEHAAQPENFRSIPQSMWWAVITMTTIGYGDVYPVTPMGQLVGSFVAILGICSLALPIGLLGSAFVEAVEDERAEGNSEGGSHTTSVEKDRCPHCNHQITGLKETPQLLEPTT